MNRNNFYDNIVFILLFAYLIIIMAAFCGFLASRTRVVKNEESSSKYELITTSTTTNKETTTALTTSCTDFTTKATTDHSTKETEITVHSDIGCTYTEERLRTTMSTSCTSTNTIIDTITTEQTYRTNDTIDEISYVKTFSRGTYYCYGGEAIGGSGRQLISCSVGDGGVKGSIASSYLYNIYGYNYNNHRTIVYLEVSGYQDMNGYYYLDDSDAGNPDVIDFFYIFAYECPFSNQGIVEVNCYIVN